MTQARADAIALARYMEFYGGAADKVHGETIPYLDGYTVYTLREPHGVTGHIVPWNYPMQIIGRSVGAALAMGNAAVLKPAEEACLTALMFAELTRQAGLPDGALNVVPGLGTLELGGKSPQLVFEDANLDDALPFLVNAGIQNAGQTCSASSRILVHHTRYDEVVAAMSERYKALMVGPALADLNLGPLISQRQKSIVTGFLKQGEDLQIAATGQISPDAPSSGAYVAPHLLLCPDPNHPLAQQEIFGPVQVIIPFKDEAGARQMRLAKALKSGQVFINNYGAGGGVELPFGGIGKSGHGREKGFEALYGF